MDATTGAGFRPPDRQQRIRRRRRVQGFGPLAGNGFDDDVRLRPLNRQRSDSGNDGCEASAPQQAYEVSDEFKEWIPARLCRKNLGRVRETSGIQVGVGKRARVPESIYRYFILGKCMYVRGGMEGGLV